MLKSQISLFTLEPWTAKTVESDSGWTKNMRCYQAMMMMDRSTGNINRLTGAIKGRRDSEKPETDHQTLRVLTSVDAKSKHSRNICGTINLPITLVPKTALPSGVVSGDGNYSQQ